MEVLDPYSLDPVIDNHAQDDYLLINNDGYAAEVINRRNRAAGKVSTDSRNDLVPNGDKPFLESMST